MKKLILVTALLLIPFMGYAEIVRNSSGEKIELKSDGTWIVIKPSLDDIVTDDKKYTVKIEDGNKILVDVFVHPNITLMGVGRPLTKEEMEFQIKTSSISAQYKLKNKYSYVPKDIFINQKGKDVKIRIDYIGKNSYGADVPSSYESTYYIEDNGKLKRTSSMF